MNRKLFLKSMEIGDIDLIKNNIKSFEFNDYQLGKFLEYTASQGFSDIVTLLLDDKVNPNWSNHYGDTPLMAATFNNFPFIAKELISAGADINQQDIQGNTVLMRLVFAPVFNAQYLIDMKANLYHKNHDGLSVFDLAEKRGLDSIFDTLILNS